MTANHLNIRLLEIYEEYNAFLFNQYKQFEGCSSPLFMWVFEDYVAASKRVLIVGKETNGGWGNIEEENGVQKLQNWYEEFKLGQNADTQRPYLTSPFWNFSRRFYLQMNRLNWSERKKTGFLWTNISKIDKNADSPPSEIRKLNKKGFELLREEVKILNPDVVLFLTGKEYDKEIVNYLHLQIDNNFNETLNISKIIDEQGDFPKHTYKTHHPRYLYAQKTHNFILEEFEKIVIQVTK